MKTLFILIIIGIGLAALSILGSQLFMKKFDYVIEGDKVYYRSITHPELKVRKSVLASADALSWMNLTYGYGKDDTHVFYRGVVIRDADPHTFEIVAGNYGLSRDGHSYFLHHKLISSDRDHFEILSGKIYKDRFNVIYEGKPLHGADALTFTIVDEKGYFCKDKDNVFYFGNPIPKVDVRSFRIISGVYSSDDVRVYYGKDELDGADPQTFEIMEEGYSGDQQSVYFRSNKISIADAPTFRTEKHPDGYIIGRDIHRTYLQGREHHFNNL